MLPMAAVRVAYNAAGVAEPSEGIRRVAQGQGDTSLATPTSMVAVLPTVPIHGHRQRAAFRTAQS